MDEDDAKPHLAVSSTERPRGDTADSFAEAPAFVHFGRGCDGCGVFPIIGTCWNCLDCPEQIGYDLCGDCMERATATLPSSGRFNQHHLPDHEMEEVPQERTWLHDVQRARPDLTIPEILQLVEQMVPDQDSSP